LIYSIVTSKLPFIICPYNGHTILIIVIVPNMLKLMYLNKTNLLGYLILLQLIYRIWLQKTKILRILDFQVKDVSMRSIFD
jgi:hypothetical protein